MKQIRSFLLPSALYLALSSLPAQAQGWPTKPLRLLCRSPQVARSTSWRARYAIRYRRSSAKRLSWKIDRAPVRQSGPALWPNQTPTATLCSSIHLPIRSRPRFIQIWNYDPARDFVAVAPLGVTPFVLVANPDRKFRNAGDLVAAAKVKSGSFNYSSPGVGTGSHLSAEDSACSAGLDAVHVPFKGAVEAMTEVIACPSHRLASSTMANLLRSP